MFASDNSSGVQRTRIGKVRDLTRKFESLLITRNFNAEGGRYSLPIAKPRAAQPHRFRVVCPSCGEQVFYLQMSKEQAAQQCN